MDGVYGTDTRHLASSVGQDPLTKYKITDIENGVTVNYYGFVTLTGAWILLEEDLTAGTYRYINGASAYAAAWTGRASQPYDYLFNLTGV
jgi:hypothetical protein